MQNIQEWAKQWRVPDQAIAQLVPILAVPDAPVVPGSEAAAQQEIRLSAPHHDMYLWRNNSGAFKNDSGRFVRFGLGNDSSKINAVMKSSDLIGFKRVLITPAHVGRLFAIFTAVECKPEGWHQIPSDKRAAAQGNYISLVNANGGLAAFMTHAASLQELTL